MNAAPALGPKPEFTLASTIIPSQKSLKELSCDQFVEEVKRLLSTPHSEIAYTELIEGETKRAYETIQVNSNYHFSITPELFFSIPRNTFQSSRETDGSVYNCCEIWRFEAAAIIC